MIVKKLRTPFVFLAILIPLAQPGAAQAENLAGVPTLGPQWGSSWIDLDPPIDFAKGERLKIAMGGNATRILVRLLPKGVSPETSEGIIGGVIKVPRSRVVEIKLAESRKQIVQISVHGGPSPWGKFQLGENNEPATIDSVERLKR